MKKTYDLDLVKDYVEGNDITDYELDELENDLSFMRTVIIYTKDKNMFDFCSDNLKQNFDFIKFIINEFKDDIKFICAVADNFLEKNDDEEIKIELLILMSKLTENKNEEYFKKCKLILNVAYVAKMMEIEVCKEKLKNDKDFQGKIDMGFIFIYDEYAHNNIVMNFFAEEFINEIFSNEDINLDLEKQLHKEFIKFDDIENKGINSYIINLLSNYDKSLSAYVSAHPELLSKLKNKINKIKLNWDNYNQMQERNKYEILIEQVRRYMDEYGYKCEFGANDILYYVAKELKVLEQLKKYDYAYDEEYKTMFEELNFGKKEMNFEELKHYHNVKKIMTNILEQKIIEEPNSNYNFDSHKRKK